MKQSFWIFSMLCLLTLAGCSSYTVVSDYDRTMPFHAYKTYRWTQTDRAGSGEDMLLRNPLTYKHIKATVDRDLTAKGFVRKGSGPVDFTIDAHAGVRERVYIDPPPAGFGYYRGWHRRGYMPFWYAPYPYPTVRYYEEGTLIIDIFDTRSDDIAWRGVARGILRDYQSRESLYRDIDKAVGKIMDRFPPLVR